MKVLLLHSIWDEPNKMSAVDIWRIQRPWQELKKHVDWQIDEAPTAIKELDELKDSKEFSNKELEESGKWLGQYDIIHTSYFTNAAQFALLMTVQKMYGTKIVLDIDDDMFSINPDNPFWLKCTHEDVFNMQQMIRHVDYITTTTPRLAHELQIRRLQKKETVFVVPNYLPDTYKEGNPDNGDKIIVGYFGGASHYRDLNETGCLEGLERVMHRHKNVHFQAVGMVVDKYIPKGRSEYIDGMRGTSWPEKLFPTLHFDISLGPLEDTIFARSKSIIKWMESTRMGAAFVASNVGPYQMFKDGYNAILTKNNPESWEKAIELAVVGEKLRKSLVFNSREDLRRGHRLEDHWNVLKETMEKIHEMGSGNTNKPSGKILTLS